MCARTNHVAKSSRTFCLSKASLVVLRLRLSYSKIPTIIARKPIIVIADT